MTPIPLTVLASHCLTGHHHTHRSQLLLSAPAPAPAQSKTTPHRLNASSSSMIAISRLGTSNQLSQQQQKRRIKRSRIWKRQTTLLLSPQLSKRSQASHLSSQRPLQSNTIRHRLNSLFLSMVTSSRLGTFNQLTQHQPNKISRRVKRRRMKVSVRSKNKDKSQLTPYWGTQWPLKTNNQQTAWSAFSRPSRHLSKTTVTKTRLLRCEQNEVWRNFLKSLAKAG